MKVRIREIRRAAGVTQVALASAVGLDQSQISRMERGITNVTVEHLAAIAAALKVPVAALLDDSTDSMATKAA